MDETPTPTIEEITASLENLADLDADGLAQLAADIRAAYESARNPEADESGSAVVDFTVLEGLRDGLAKVTERQAEVAAEQAAGEARLAELDAEVAAIGTDDETERSEDDLLAELAALSDEDREQVGAWAQAIADQAAPDGGEPAETPEPEAPAPEAAEPARAASAPSAPTLLRTRSVRQPQPAETPAEQAPAAVTFDEGRPMDRDAVVRALQDAGRRYGNTPGREVRVASLLINPDLPRMDEIEDPRAEFDRQLDVLRQHRHASAADAMSGNTRQASGTLCAPHFVDNSIMNLGTEDEPVGNIFPRFSASEADSMKTMDFFRAIGFDQFLNADGDTFGDAAAGVSASTLGLGAATATENATTPGAANSPYPKTALRVDCPEPVSCEQRAHWVELLWDNWLALAWPELVSAVDQAGRVAVAEDAEEWRLQDWFDAADATGTNVLSAFAQPWNGNHSLLQAVLSVVTHDRSAKRDWNAGYVVTVPEWYGPALATETLAMLDIASGSMTPEQARAAILEKYNVTVVGYLGHFGKDADARTTLNGVPTKLPAINDSVPLFPCAARIGIARDDAAFTRVGAEINLGMLRTQDDLENNDHRTFYETWRRTCFRIPPFVADVQINPSAVTQNVAAGITDNCSGSGS